LQRYLFFLNQQTNGEYFCLPHADFRSHADCTEHTQKNACGTCVDSGMKGSLFNTNCHELPVNFREYFLAELLLHAVGTESTDDADYSDYLVN
jgi:hypothetical protein